VPAFRGAVSRSVHISAPHPGYDLGTVEQAAYVFENTGSKSLLVPGWMRTAFLQPSNGIVPASAKQDYYMIDPAHNNVCSSILFTNRPSLIAGAFFDTSISIYDWQHKKDNCLSPTCGFVQFHGKGPSTCPSNDIFLSSGIGHYLVCTPLIITVLSFDRKLFRL